ncbi:MAG: hypothetical protein IT373_24525 [Polyangiaceae bacterium]|nr:hypothetical protein [Polyangiaceae bacterium]
MLAAGETWKFMGSVRLQNTAGAEVAAVHLPDLGDIHETSDRATPDDEEVALAPLPIDYANGARLGTMRFCTRLVSGLRKITGSTIATERGTFSAIIEQDSAEIRAGKRLVCCVTKEVARWYQRLGGLRVGPCRVEFCDPHLPLDERLVFITVAVNCDAWRFQFRDTDG